MTDQAYGQPLTWPGDGVFPTLCWPLPTVNYKNWAGDPSNPGRRETTRVVAKIKRLRRARRLLRE